ncbi:MAG: VWA domain-containing protein [Rhabdochlamydiaceae bacterium]|nr:VWA domain-containing protein [Rhabdochlamydiaceae bacterium]
MTTLLHTAKRKSAFFKCLAASLVLHLIGVIYFYTHPILIHSSWKSLFGFSSTLPSVLEQNEESLEEANLILEEAFEKIFVLPHHLRSPLDSVELPKGMPLSPTEEELTGSSLALEHAEMQFDDDLLYAGTTSAEEFEVIDALPFEPLFSPKLNPIAVQSQLNVDQEPSLAPLASLPLPFEAPNLIESVDPDLLSLHSIVLEATDEITTSGVNVLDTIPSLTATEQEAWEFKTDLRSQLATLQTHDLESKSDPIGSSVFAATAPLSKPVETKIDVARELPDVEEYELPILATASQWSDDFDVQLQFFPKEDGEGYTFAASITPTFDISQYSMKQNLYFILDRSNSIERPRFSVFKRAIVKALSCMQPGDAFNIYVVDKKIVKMSPTPVKYSAKALRNAEEFLEKQQAGGHFNTADIYTTLEKLIPDSLAVDEIHTAILLTDGNGLQNTSKQQKLLTRWLEKNNGQLALYTAAVGQKNNLVMLDLLSSISGGKLLYSDTHASFPRKLGKLVLDLQGPVLSDLMVTAIPDNAAAHVEISNASKHLPTLYSAQPYVIVGTIDEPCNFDLLIQGRHGEEWVTIKKNLSFIEAEKANRTQARQWESLEANTCYLEFLQKGNAELLKEARKILKSTRSQIAFE